MIHVLLIAGSLFLGIEFVRLVFAYGDRPRKNQDEAWSPRQSGF